jgi:tellurite resistance protein
VLTAVGRRSHRIPPNVFPIPFGLAGLADAWNAARPLLHVSAAVPRVIYVLAAVVWLMVLVAYVAQGPLRIMADLRDPVLGSFLSLAVITPMILAAALAAVAFSAGRVLVVLFLVLTVVLGGWLTGQWIVGDLNEDNWHPGDFLPTVAGSLLGASAAATVHLQAAAEAAFGIGLICWLLLGSMTFSRLFFRPMPPPALVPTLAIEIAPPALAGIAYFALNGGSVNLVAYGLGGYVVIMALVQLRLVPRYARLRFSLESWAFTFSYAAVATDAIAWITVTRPRGTTGYAIVVVTLITVFVAAIAVRTVIALARGQFLPAPQAAELPADRQSASGLTNDTDGR